MTSRLLGVRWYASATSIPRLLRLIGSTQRHFGGLECIAIMPDGEDVELEDQRVMEVLASECIVLSPRKLPRNTLFVAIAVD
jgi:hypothetical protein